MGWGAGILKTDYLSDPRLAHVPFSKLKKHLESNGASRDDLFAALTKFALVATAEKLGIQLDSILDEVTVPTSARGSGDKKGKAVKKTGIDETPRLITPKKAKGSATQQAAELREQSPTQANAHASPPPPQTGSQTPPASVPQASPAVADLAPFAAEAAMAPSGAADQKITSAPAAGDVGSSAFETPSSVTLAPLPDYDKDMANATAFPAPPTAASTAAGGGDVASTTGAPATATGTPPAQPPAAPNPLAADKADFNRVQAAISWEERPDGVGFQVTIHILDSPRDRESAAAETKDVR